MKIYLITATICLLISCNKKESNVSLVEYQDGRQLLTLNDKTEEGDTLIKPTVKLLAPDTINVNDKFQAKIYLSDKNYKLIAAYFDCQLVTNPTVDTVINTKNDYKRLDGCKKGLFVKNDTILIEFEVATAGKKKFEEITILTFDQNKIFRTQNYTFDYYVKD